MISIIGTGKIGSAIGFLIASNSLDDLTLVNRTKNKAIGEQLDLSNAIPSNSSIIINATDDFSQIKNSDTIVITASYGTYSTSRSEIIQDQISMMKRITEKIKPFVSGAKILMVSNPLDVLTYVLLKEGQFSSNQVIGIASSLDTARFRYILAKELDSSISEINDALVLGEHGDTMVPIFSKTKKNQTPVLDILNPKQIESVTQKVRLYWKTLREYKSRSVFGISKQVFDVLEAIKNKKEISIPTSVLLDGEYGISDVCIGVPTTISKDGLKQIHEIELNGSELSKLKNSAISVKNSITDCF